MIVEPMSKAIIINLLSRSYRFADFFQNSLFSVENTALIEAYSASQAQAIHKDETQLILDLKQAITQHPMLLSYLQSQHNEEYKELVLTAVTQNGMTLQYASAELQADKEIVMAAVQQDGFALEYASAGLKADREIVMAAVQQNGEALLYASAELRADREIVMTAVQKNGWALQYASAALKADGEVVMATVAQDGWTLEYASSELQENRDIIIAAIQSDVEALCFAKGEFASYPQLIHDTLKRDYRAIFFINKNNIFNQLSKELQDHINKCIVQFESIPIIEYDELCYTNWLLDEEDESGETHHVIYDYDKNQITSIEVFEQKFKAKYFDPKNIKYSQESKAQQLLNQVKRLADQVCHELGNTPLNEYLIDKAEVEKKQTQSYALLSTLFSKKTGANAYDMQKTQIHTTTSMAQETTSSESTATPGPESIVVQYLTAHDILFRLIPTRKVPQPNHVTYHDPTQHVAKKPTLM